MTATTLVRTCSLFCCVISFSLVLHVLDACAEIISDPAYPGQWIRTWANKILLEYILDAVRSTVPRQWRCFQIYYLGNYQRGLFLGAFRPRWNRSGTKLYKHWLLCTEVCSNNRVKTYEHNQSCSYSKRSHVQSSRYQYVSLSLSIGATRLWVGANGAVGFWRRRQLRFARRCWQRRRLPIFWRWSLMNYKHSF